MKFFQIIKRSSRITTINAFGAILNFLVATYVAGKLGPDSYGRISFVLLWVSYAGLARLGFFEGGQRRFISLAGTGKVEEARKYQNVGISAELLWTLIPALCLGAMAHGLPDPIRRAGFLVAPFLFLAQAMTRMLGGLYLAHQKYAAYTVIVALRAGFQPILMLLMLPGFGAKALILAPTAAEWIAAGFCLWRMDGLGIVWKLDRGAAFELLKGGFSLSIAAIAYWAYRLAGPTSIAIALSATTLGAYAFASKLIDQITRFFGDFSNIMMPSLWRNISEAGTASAVLNDLAKINTQLILAACLTCNLIQASAFAPIIMFLPRFTASIGPLEILAFNVVLLTVTMAPGLVLDSAVVNKPGTHLWIWILGAALNYVVNFIALALGHGVTAIAWNDILMQLLVVSAVYGVMHSHISAGPGTTVILYAPLVAILGCCAVVFVMLKATLDIPVHGTWSVARVVLVRDAAVVAVWVCMASIIHKLSFSNSTQPQKEAVV